MKKILPLILVVLFTINTTYSQKRKKGDWILLNEPRTELIGKEVGKLIKKQNNSYEITNIEGTTALDNEDFLTKDGANQKTEVEKYYRNIYSKYFQSEKTLDLNITAKNVKIHDLSMKGFDKIGYNKKIVVSGITADTIDVTVSFKKDNFTDIGKITNDIIDKVEKAYPELPTKIKEIAKIDTLSIKRNDSIVFTYKIYNANVLYKVKVAKVKLVNSKMRTNYGKLFWVTRTSEPEFVYLDNNEKTSPKKYAEWWGKGSNVGGQAWLRYEINNGKLYANYEGIEIEIPQTSQNFWDTKQYITTENKGKKSKMIIISVLAKREPDGRLKITQRRYGDLATYLHYPEFKYKYY